MQPRIAGTTLLITLFLAARASGEEAESRPPVRPGAMIGLVSLPRPIDAEVFVRIVDIFGVGLGYSDFPAFIANPLLELVGAKSDSTDARLDQFNAFDLDLHVFPFRGRFFVGSSFGRQSLKGAVTENTALGPQTATVDLTTWYATPRVGWIWTFEHGFFLGFALGVQFKLGADKTVTVPPSATPDIRNRVDNLADLGSSYPLPSLHLRLGWMP